LAEDARFLLDEEGDQWTGEVQGWCEDDADCWMIVVSI
jgi:hypothetical protein